MKTLFSSAYWGSIDYYAAWVASENPIIEVCEHYQKQTYRSRAHIYGANGLLSLNVPIRHSRGGTEGHQMIKDTLISDEFPWRREHFRSLETAYRTSPYFEYYEDSFSHIYDTAREGSLLELNLETHRVVCRLLGIDSHIEQTTSYEKNPYDTLDLRNAFLPKKPSQSTFEPYTQVFEDKCGFIPNMSILDLLFCIGGREALSYLKNHSVTL